MLKKARQRKHGGHPTILSRWYGDEKIQEVIVGHRMERTPHHIEREDRPGDAHPQDYES